MNRRAPLHTCMYVLCINSDLDASFFAGSGRPMGSASESGRNRRQDRREDTPTLREELKHLTSHRDHYSFINNTYMHVDSDVQ